MIACDSRTWTWKNYDRNELLMSTIRRRKRGGLCLFKDKCSLLPKCHSAYANGKERWFRWRSGDVTEVKSLAVILSNKTSFPAELVAAGGMWPRIARKI